MEKRCTHRSCFLLITLCILLISSIRIPAQTRAIDSLKNHLQNHPQADRSRLNTLITLCTVYLDEMNGKKKMAEHLPEINTLSKKFNDKRGIAYAYLFSGLSNFRTGKSTTIIEQYFLALKQLEEIGDKKGLAICYLYLAQAHYHIGKYNEAMQYDQKSIKIKLEINDRIGISNSYNGIGSCYYIMGNYQQALLYYFKALKIAEETNAKFGISRSQLNIALVFLSQNKFDASLSYMEKALKTKKEIEDYEGEGLIYINMAAMYTLKKEYAKAIDCCLKAIHVSEKMTVREVALTAYVNLASIYVEQQKIDEALVYFMKTYEGSIKTGDKITLVAITAGIGSCYEQKKDPAAAIQFYKKSLDMAEEADYKTGVRDACSNLSKLYEKQGDYQQALTYDKLLAAVKDTLLNEESLKQTSELNARYETDKKEKEILLLTKDQQLKDKTLKEQRLVRIGLIIGLGLFLSLSFLLYNRYRFKQRANLILEKQKEVIYHKNTLITDSIDYAKTIQEAILPDDEKLQTVFQDYFILYKPKAIVSGDFYWVGKKEGSIICAVADCTGHGVPGAFMSLLGHNILENVIQRDIADPGSMLTELNKEIVLRFSKEKDGENIKHAMDIAIIRIDPATQQLQYAGAGNSVYLVRDHVLTEIKADKQSTGIISKDHNDVIYTNHTHDLKTGDMIYLFSDGFADQKGGPDNRKFYYQPFKDLLAKMSQLPVNQQKQQLDEALSAWMGAGEQIDDILIMGIRC